MNHHNKEDKKIITEVAETPSQIYIAIIDVNPPVNAVFELKYLKEGRKLGADPSLNKKQAKLVTKKVMRNAIVIKVAIWLMSAKRKTCASTHVRNMA